MSFKDFVFEYENLEWEARILSSTFSACHEELNNNTADAEYVLAGLHNGIYELSKKMSNLLDKGFESIRRE